MRTPRPLPAELGDAFTVADARQHGVGWSRLRGADLERPFHGVRTRASLNAARDDADESAWLRAEVIRLAQAYSPRMRSTEFFSHITAAVLWGIPLPPLPDRIIHVAVLRPGRAPKAAGLHGHSLDSALVYVTDHNGFRLTTPAPTWASLGTALEPYDLVAAGDAIICQRNSAGGSGGPPPRSLATLGQLGAAINAGRRPGLVALRDAFGHIRPGSWSRPESWVRLILVDAGLPEPVLNFDAFSEGGLFLGCVDLAYPELKIAIEYEGAHHWSTAAQIQHDIDRLDRLVENGWRIVRLTKRHVFMDPTEVVRRVATARDQRLSAH